MTALTFLGDFPQVALALAFSLGCALLGAFIILRVVVGLVTREQYNVTDAPRRIRALVWIGHGSDSPNPIVGNGGRSTARRPYLLPAAAPHNRFARLAESGDARTGRVIELSQRAAGGTAESGPRSSGTA